MPCRLISIGLAAAGLLLGAAVHAAPITGYTDFDAWRTAVAAFGPQRTEGFDGLTAPLDVAEGDGVGGWSFGAFDLGGALLRVVHRTGQTSSAINALETDQGEFVGGDGFTISSATGLRAFGLFVVSADDLLDGDLTLMIAGERVDLVAAAAITGARLWTEFDFTDNTNARLWFLGATATLPFTAVELTSRADAFVFGLDDVRGVPGPPVWALLGPGLLLLMRSSRRVGWVPARPAGQGGRVALK